MLGPHYQRMAEADKQLTGKQMLQRIQLKQDSPLTQIIDKLKTEFAGYQTAYTEDIIDHQITSIDRLLSFDGKLGPILSTLEKQNNLLRREMSLLETQLSNTIGICEQIIAENGDLKNALVSKNDDISKIIETIAHHQSESLSELEGKILILQHENSILIQHLEEVKAKHQDYIHEFKERDKELGNWTRKWEEAKSNLSGALDRERDLSRKLAISQNLLYEQKQRSSITEQKLSNSEFEVNELRSKLHLEQGKTSAQSIEAIKKQIQSEYVDLIEEHKNLKKERIEVMRDAEKSKMQKQKLEDVLQDMQKKFNKVLTELELSTSLINEQKQKNQTLVATLKKVELKLDECKGENLKSRMEVEELKTIMQSRQRSMNEEIETLRKQLYEKSRETESKLREVKLKTNQLLEAKDMEMRSVNETNAQLRRLLQRKQ